MSHPVNDWLKQQGRRKSWLAGQVGVSDQHLNRLLRADGNFTTEIFEKIGAATGIDPIDLFAIYRAQRTAREAKARSENRRAIADA